MKNSTKHIRLLQVRSVVGVSVTGNDNVAAVYIPADSVLVVSVVGDNNDVSIHRIIGLEVAYVGKR